MEHALVHRSQKVSLVKEGDNRLDEFPAEFLSWSKNLQRSEIQVRVDALWEW